MAMDGEMPQEGGQAPQQQSSSLQMVEGLPPSELIPLINSALVKLGGVLQEAGADEQTVSAVAEITARYRDVIKGAQPGGQEQPAPQQGAQPQQVNRQPQPMEAGASGARPAF